MTLLSQQKPMAAGMDDCLQRSSVLDKSLVVVATYLRRVDSPSEIWFKGAKQCHHIVDVVLCSFTKFDYRRPKYFINETQIYCSCELKTGY